jgi:hypothetical protein
VSRHALRTWGGRMRWFTRSRAENDAELTMISLTFRRFAGKGAQDNAYFHRSAISGLEAARDGAA